MAGYCQVELQGEFTFWQLSCQVLPTAPKFSMACHGSGSRYHFPPPSAAQRLSVSSSRSGRCFGIMIPCLCQLASHGSTEDDRCCSHIVSAPCPPPPDIDPVATTRYLANNTMVKTDVSIYRLPVLLWSSWISRPTEILVPCRLQ